MGHHIDCEGRFQSDKNPGLPSDKIVVSFKDRRAWRALQALAEDYRGDDPELAADVETRLATIKSASEQDVAPVPKTEASRRLLNGARRCLPRDGGCADFFVVAVFAGLGAWTVGGWIAAALFG